MDRSGVKVAFSTILEEIETVIIDVNNKGAQSFHDGQYEEATKLSKVGHELAQFREKVRALQEEWNNNFSTLMHR
jgi:restriction system protein